MSSDNQKYNIIPVDKDVAWESQAAGSYTKKLGKVICFLPGGESAKAAIEKHSGKVVNVQSPQEGQLGYNNIKGQLMSTTARYLVLVPRLGKKGDPTGTVDYYMPLAKNLNTQNGYK